MLAELPPAFQSRIHGAIISIGLPDQERRKKGLKFLLRDVPQEVFDDVDDEKIGILARDCSGFSGRDIEHVVRIAARLAKKAAHPKVRDQDLRAAIIQVKNNKRQTALGWMKETGKAIWPYIPTAISFAQLVLNGVGLYCNHTMQIRFHDEQRSQAIEFHDDQMDHARNQMNQAARFHGEQKVQSDKQMRQSSELNKMQMVFNLKMHQINTQEQAYKEALQLYLRIHDRENADNGVNAYLGDKQNAFRFPKALYIMQHIAKDVKSFVHADDNIIEQVEKATTQLLESKGSDSRALKELLQDPPLAKEPPKRWDGTYE